MGSAPLMVWAAHFFFCYVLVAAACTRQAGDATTVKWILAGVSVVAVVATVTMTWPALGRIVRNRPARGLADTARAVGGVLALIAMLWTSLPIFVLPMC